MHVIIEKNPIRPARLNIITHPMPLGAATPSEVPQALRGEIR